MKKRVIGILLLFSTAVSCQFYSPECNTMEDYTKFLCELFIENPTKEFYSKDTKLVSWTTEDKENELQYTFSVQSPSSMTCSIVNKPDPEESYHRIRGTVKVQLNITESNGFYYCTASGTITEDEGYKTDVSGDFKIYPFTGTFRAETSQNGHKLDWCEAVYNESYTPFCQSGVF